MMYDVISVVRLLPRAWVAIVVVVMMAACSGSRHPSSTGTSGSPSGPSAVAYSACMRSHGVPSFPDPGSGGAIPKGDAQHFGVSAAQFQAAQRSCQGMIPTGGSLDQQSRQCFEGGDCPQALVQQILTAQRRFAACMRSHGWPKFPDPTIDSEGRPVFAWSISKTGMDPHSARYQAKEDECQRQAPAPEARRVDP